MRKSITSLLSVTVAIFGLTLMSSCKTSGLAVTKKGQILKLDIDSPKDLSEGQTEKVAVSVANVGVNNIRDVVFEVSMPDELVVLSSVPDERLTASESLNSEGKRVYAYGLHELHTGQVATVEFHVRAAFGALERTGDIRMTAWSETLPGDKLVETRFVRLRR